MKIEVVDVRLVDPKESGLRGFADVKLDDTILIRDYRIVQRNGKLFVEGPHTTYRKDGKLIFNDIVSFPDELRVQINTAILTAYFREKEKSNGQTQPLR